MCVSLSVWCPAGGGLPRTVSLTITALWDLGIKAPLGTRARHCWDIPCADRTHLWTSGKPAASQPGGVAGCGHVEGRSRASRASREEQKCTTGTYQHQHEKWLLAVPPPLERVPSRPLILQQTFKAEPVDLLHVWSRSFSTCYFCSGFWASESVHKPFKNSFSFLQPFGSPRHQPLWFSKSDVLGAHLSAAHSKGSGCGAQTLTLRR